MSEIAISLHRWMYLVCVAANYNVLGMHVEKPRMKALTGIGLFEYLPDDGRPATQSTLFFSSVLFMNYRFFMLYCGSHM